MWITPKPFGAPALLGFWACGKAWDALGIKTRYYNTELHKGSFALPNYVKEMLKNAESMGY